MILKLREKSKEIEHKIISHIANRAKDAVSVFSILNEDDFSDVKNKKAFIAVKESVLKEEDIYSKFEDAGLLFSDFVNVDFSDVTHKARTLKRISTALKLNKLIERWTNRIDNTNIDESISNFTREFSQSTGLCERERTDIKSIIADYEKDQELYAEKYRNGDKLLGLSTGFGKIDNVIDGIRSGHFWVIGGYNNTGKTFLALNIVVSLLNQGKRVVIYSMEMSKKDLAGRLMGILADMNSAKILKGILTSEESEKQMKAKGILWEKNLNIYQDLDDYEQIKLSMYEESMKELVDCFVIDYMQLLKSTNLNEYQLMTMASSEFQSIGRKTGVPIIALSQISNEVAKNADRSVGGYKGSGGIEASSDIALKLVQTEELKTVQEKQKNHVPINIDCIITKNRHGIKGLIPMSFEGYTGIFYEGYET